MRGDGVALAYVHPDRVSSSWASSMFRLLEYDSAGLQLIRKRIPIYYQVDGLPESRNLAIERFLETNLQWLWWTDTDMSFAPDALERLYTAALQDDAAVVGALYFSAHPAPDGLGGFRLTLLPVIQDLVDGYWQVRSSYPSDRLVACTGTGSGCILVARKVFEAIGHSWYDRMSGLGDDISFCVRAANAGVQVYVHTGVKAAHHKSVWLGEMDYRQQQATLSAEVV